MKLFFREYGHGQPLIILHGLYGSSDNWVHIARALEDDFTVYLPDMRNHGRSAWSYEHTYLSISEDIRELMDNLGLAKAFIAGHSMGGKAMTMLAVNHPERVAGLFIGDISPFSYNAGGQADTLHRDIIGILNTVDPGAFATRKEAEDYLTTLAGEKTTMLVFSKNIATDNGTMRWRLNARALQANMERFLEGIPRPVAGSRVFNGFPVTVLRGDRSIYLDERDVNDLKILFPGIEIRTATDSGHWIHTDNPAAVIKALRDLKLSAGSEEGH